MSKVTDKRWKGFKIDWAQIESMDSEYQERKLLTQQHVAILLALLEYQKWTTRWENLGLTAGELQSFIGDIEYRLMQDEGSFLMTPEEFYDANKRSIYDAWNDIAKQIVSGRTTDISVGSDGTVTNPTDTVDGGTLPEDDPTTAVNETKGGKYGAAVAIAEGIEAVWDKIDSLYGAVNGTPVTLEADAAYQMKLLFPCDETLMGNAVNFYYLYRGTNPRFLYDIPVGMYQYMYCKGLNKETALRYMVDVVNFVIAKQTAMNNFILALSDAFFSYYFGIGSQTPSTAYLEASCEPSPPETMLLLVGGTTYTSNTAFKANHRLRITVSGYFQDSSVTPKISDFWWYSFPPAVPANHISATNIQQGTGIVKPTVNQVPYAGGHSYQFTMDTTSAGNMQITVPVAGMTAPITSPTGGITVTIVDLGEYIG